MKTLQQTITESIRFLEQLRPYFLPNSGSPVTNLARKETRDSVPKTLCAVCSYRVTYAFQSESTIYSCLIVNELFARNKRDIWSLNDCNVIRTHNHLVRKRTLNQPICLNGWVFDYDLSGCGFDSRCSHIMGSAIFYKIQKTN